MPNQAEDRLTEMLTVVVTPSMRARVQEAAEKRGHIPYSFVVRWAIQEWLDANEQKTEDEIHKLGVAWLESKFTANHKDGHA
jgi:Arc/MetJ-type ribon-helix-helix transcriptional regulator